MKFVNKRNVIIKNTGQSGKVLSYSFEKHIGYKYEVEIELKNGVKRSWYKEDDLIDAKDIKEESELNNGGEE